MVEWVIEPFCTWNIITHNFVTNNPGNCLEKNLRPAKYGCIIKADGKML